MRGALGRTLLVLVSKVVILSLGLWTFPSKIPSHAHHTLIIVAFHGSRRHGAIRLLKYPFAVTLVFFPINLLALICVPYLSYVLWDFLAWCIGQTTGRGC